MTRLLKRKKVEHFSSLPFLRSNNAIHSIQALEYFGAITRRIRSCLHKGDVYMLSKCMLLFTSVQLYQQVSLAASSVPAGTSRNTSYTPASYQIQQTCSCKNRVKVNVRKKYVFSITVMYLYQSNAYAATFMSLKSAIIF